MATLEKLKTMQEDIESAAKQLTDLMKEAAAEHMICEVDLLRLTRNGTEEYQRVSVACSVRLDAIDQETELV